MAHCRWNEHPHWRLPRQFPLDRPDSTRAALIPIRKNDAWWALTQDERHATFAEQHNAIGFQYLPAISRRLHHCRDLSTREWNFVDWEIDIRLSRE